MEEFKVQQNTGYVAPASGDMSAAQIEEIKRQASVQVTTARVEGAKAQEAEKKAAQNDEVQKRETSAEINGGKLAYGGGSGKGSAEARFYGDIGMEVAGVKVMGMVADFLEDRFSGDPAAGFTPPDAKKKVGLSGLSPAAGPIKTFESDRSAFGRAPGYYPAASAPEKTGKAKDDDGDAKKKFTLDPVEGDRLIGGVNSFRNAIVDPERKGMKSNPPTDFQSRINETKSVVFGQELANQKALESANRAEHERRATVAQINTLAPGLGGLANGPSIKPKELLSEVKEDAADGTRQNGGFGGSGDFA